MIVGDSYKEGCKWFPWKIDLFSSKIKNIKNFTYTETLIAWMLILTTVLSALFYTIYFSLEKNHTELIYETGINYNGVTDFCDKPMHYTGCRCMHNKSYIFDCDSLHSDLCNQYICYGWIELDIYHIMFNYCSNIGGILGFIISFFMALYISVKEDYASRATDIINKIEEIYDIDDSVPPIEVSKKDTVNHTDLENSNAYPISNPPFCSSKVVPLETYSSN